MTTKPQKVLLVDIGDIWLARWEQALAGKVEFLHALSLEEAEELFAENKKEISGIMVIACMNSDQPDTMPLIRKFRKASEVPIMGISQFPESRAELKKAGCTYESIREDVPQKLLEMLQQ